MRKLSFALVLAAVLPAAARAEPITVSLHSSATSGFTGSATAAVDAFAIDIGTFTMGRTDSVGTFFFDGLRRRANYSVDLTLINPMGFDTLRLEVLNPSGAVMDRFDPADQPSYIPAGFSTSNNRDGFSFAQGSALERSAVFAGGSASLSADEDTDRGDVLIFSGIAGADELRVNFGLRDYSGGRGFLVRVSGLDPTVAPEPASMLLIGTGLAGLAGVYRRRRRESDPASE